MFIIILTTIFHHCFYAAGSWILGFSREENFQAALFSLPHMFRTFATAMVFYPAIITAQHAYLYFRESQERAFRLQQAELEVLKMQLHPHFFFNTLNAISALVTRSPKDAKQMIAQLGDLFRFALRRDKAQEIPLKDELDFLRAFLEIHQTLMGKRLQIEWRLQPETLDALVPNLILQPLAENAIQHGLAPLEEGGRITICTARENEKLVLQVSDNGQGFISQSGKTSNGGIGLSNVQARLENLYNGTHKFSIEESADKGVTVRIEIPFLEQMTEENEY
ncbi:MAG: sensor histidine kinase [Aridibacter sp.]